MAGNPLVLAVKNGNAETMLGLFDGEKLLGDWALTTQMSMTPDEVELAVHSFLNTRNLPMPDDSILCSVVPSLTTVWRFGLRNLTGQRPLVVGPGVKTGLVLGYKDPGQLGGDRVVCAVAAKQLFGAPLIVCDFGTTTNVSAIDSSGKFLGGAIAPGLGVSMEALCESAAQLAEVGMEVPDRAIGRTTAEAIRVGVVLGEAARIDGIVRSMSEELGCAPSLVATGRYAPMVCMMSSSEFEICEDLALRGLQMIYALNRG